MWLDNVSRSVEWCAVDKYAGGGGGALGVVICLEKK